jgi:hypothetical protein
MRTLKCDGLRSPSRSSTSTPSQALRQVSVLRPMRAARDPSWRTGSSASTLPAAKLSVPA